MKLENKVAVVTGGASGIGAAIVRRFAAEGARVFIGDVREREAEAVARDAGPHVQHLACDVTDPGQVRGLAQAAMDEWGQLDVMVNNAGIEVVAPASGTTEADWLRTLDINLTGVMHGTLAALHHMVPAGGGVILNTASIAGTWGAPGMAAYAASKGGVVQYTRAVALEHARHNIRCNAVCPGLIDTPMAERSLGVFGEPAATRRRLEERVPVGRFGRAEEVAALFAFLASDDATYITAQAIVIDGGLSIGPPPAG